MNKAIEQLLNDQIKYEAQASMQYLAMASWADSEGYGGVANFFYLSSISTMGSAGFLLIFAAVNAANIRLARQTGSRRWISSITFIASTPGMTQEDMIEGVMITRLGDLAELTLEADKVLVY